MLLSIYYELFPLNFAIAMRLYGVTKITKLCKCLFICFCVVFWLLRKMSVIHLSFSASKFIKSINIIIAFINKQSQPNTECILINALYIVYIMVKLFLGFRKGLGRERSLQIVYMQQNYVIL